MANLTNPHDAFFKQFLSRPELAADFLRHHLPVEVLALVDLARLELQLESFVDEQLREHLTDLLYRIPLVSGEEAFVYLLFEHKSYPDRGVALQLLRYMVQIWDQRQRATVTPAPIIPLVVYHGRTPWTIDPTFGALFAVAEPLRPYLPEFRYQLVDLSRLSDEQIQGQIWTRIFQLILKYTFDPRLGERLPAILGLARELAQ
jgi:predicted transposase/invertase (TIGR01784 family)